MIDKTLQDHVWKHCLPKEFKEEVKRMYETAKSYVLGDIEINAQVCEAVLSELFGYHNLTSDAEREEMLTVKAKTVREMYAANDRLKSSFPGTIAEADADKINHILRHLFGSKCLPDEGTDCTPIEVGVAENAMTSNVDSSHGNVESLEPKPAEPKFKYNIGQKVKSVFANEILTIKEHCGCVGHDNVYKVEEYAYTWNECELRPCTEPKNKRHVSVKEACEILGVDESEATKLVKSEPIETCTETCTDDCSSPDHFVVKDEMVDNIIMRGFENHNRLHVAAMAMHGILSNPVSAKSIMVPGNMEISVLSLAEKAVKIADALTAECEKGGSE